jgi:hypothetical protein
MFSYTKLLQALQSISGAGDAFFNSVMLLLNTSSTNGAQNNTFQDSSSSPLTITRNPATGPNAPTQGTFSPFSQTGWSNYFSGSGNFLSPAAGTSDYNPGNTGAWTFETWIYLTSTTSGHFYGVGDGSAYSNSMACGYNGTRFTFSQSNGSSSTPVNITASTTHPINNWYHYAVSKDASNVIRLFINGVQVGTQTYSSTISTGNRPVINGLNDNNGLGNNGCTCYLSNLRWVKGGALYTTSPFVPPTSPLTTTVSSGVCYLLFAQTNRFYDVSGTSVFISTGAPSVQAFSPFAPTSAYSTSLVGGSGYFSTSSTYLSNTTYNTTATGDFTVEAWVYFNNLSQVDNTIVNLGSSEGTGRAYFCVSSAGQIRINLSGSSNFNFGSTGAVVAGAWNHIAFVRSGTGSNNLTAYLNGVSVGSVTNTAQFGKTGGFRIGASTIDGTRFLNGYISNARITIGTAVYTGNFNVPTSPFTASMGSNPFGGSNTAACTASVLLNFTNAGIYDAASKNVLETVGNAQVASGTYTPTATGTSGASTITVSSAIGLKRGQSVTGTGIGTNAVVTNIVSTTVTLSVVNSGTVSGTMTFTDPAKFGITSIYFDGTGDYLLIPDSVNLQLGSGDFTIDGWFYLNTAGVAYGLVSKGVTTTTGWSVNVTSGNRIQFSYSGTSLPGTVTTLVSGTWYYFAVVRSGTASDNLKLYLGTTGAVTTEATSGTAVNDVFTQTNPMYVGADRTGGAVLNGYLSQNRITKGIARTITTVPTTAFFVQ